MLNESYEPLSPSEVVHKLKKSLKHSDPEVGYILMSRPIAERIIELLGGTRDSSSVPDLGGFGLAPLGSDTKPTTEAADFDLDLTADDLLPISSPSPSGKSDDQIFHEMYESARGEVSKNGVKQKPTEEILAELDRKKPKK